MNTIKSALTSLLMAATLPVLASPTVVDFESLGDTIQASAAKKAAAAGSYANGAIVIAGSTAWLETSKGYYGSAALGNFYGNYGGTTTSFATNKAALLVSNATGGDDISFRVNIANGFNGVFSTSFVGEGQVSFIAYDKSGTEIDLTPGASDPVGTSSNAACLGSAYCNWDLLSYDFGSTDVYSIELFGTNGKVFFDNLSFGNLLAGPTNPGGSVPEPGGVALSLAALGALGWTRKRVARR
ncbi:hypothetical protein [Pelomonas sp. KK5]|uniref:hypothetical protein n=1 Tax=Pelomonas sp. KK5 TaxID=1855730 RepID=UPI00097C0A43|nr:hypothetical protein [Pelomonas sp. KK5]